MENEFEMGRSPEEPKKESRVSLHFFRHGEAERDPSKTNQEFELTEEGRKQAIKKSSAVSGAGERNLEQSVAFGSPRWRAKQTAAFAMTSELPGVINGTESLEELQEKIDQDIKVGTKIGVDPRLDFHLDKNTPFGREAYKAVFENKNYMKFLVNRSDELAIETGDQEASTYSSQAKQVAEIIKKYVSVGKQWDKLVQNDTYEDPKLERFLGTHGGVAESFLLKVVEMTKGAEERDRLLELMPHQFDYTEGFDITLTNQGQEQVLHISFKKEDKESPEKNFVFDQDVPLGVIDEIIKDTGVIRKKFK